MARSKASAKSGEDQVETVPVVEDFISDKALMLMESCYINVDQDNADADEELISAARAVALKALKEDTIGIASLRAATAAAAPYIKNKGIRLAKGNLNYRIIRENH